MGVLKFLIIASIALFPLGEIFRIQIAQSVFIKPIDIALGIAFILWLALIIKNPAFAPPSPTCAPPEASARREWLRRPSKATAGKNYLIKPVLIFIVVSLVSLIINSSLLKGSEFFTSLLYLVRWAVYASVYFIISAFDKAFKKTILIAMIITGGVVTLGGFIQYAFYQNLRNLYYLGWDEHMHRLFSSFLDPNFAGALFVLYSLFISSLLIFFVKEKKYYPVVGLRLLIVFSLIAVFLTYSRSALIMLFVGYFVFFLLIRKLGLLTFFIILFVLGLIVFSRNFTIENTNLLRTASSEARIQSAREAIYIIEKHPLLGVGFNAYRYALIRYGFRTEEGTRESHADAGTDNSFLFILATTGIIGFVSYIFIFYSILKKSLSVVIISSLVVLFVDSLFINSLFFPPIMLWMWILIGIRDYT